MQPTQDPRFVVPLAVVGMICLTTVFVAADGWFYRLLAIAGLFLLSMGTLMGGATRPPDPRPRPDPDIGDVFAHLHKLEQNQQRMMAELQRDKDAPT